MWSHFVNLFLRIIHGMPVLVSSNWASWAIGIGSFLLTEVLLFKRTPPQERGKKTLSNILLGLVVAVCIQMFLFGWSTIQTVYDDHHDAVGRWQLVVKEKNSLKAELTKRDSYIKDLEGRKCHKCPQGPSLVPSATQPRGLTDLQKSILAGDLNAGRGSKVRIISVAKSQDTHDFAEELAAVFKGWQVERFDTGFVSSNLGTSTSELEFAIPQPEDRTVQIAVHAFDHAHVQYTKNVDPNVYRGGFQGGPPPPLTIVVRDR